MSNIVKGVASAMIVILIVLLIWIFIEYYRNSAFIDTIVFLNGDIDASSLNIPSGEYISEENDIENGLIESIIGEKDVVAANKNVSGDEFDNSGNIENITSITENDSPDIIIEIPPKENEQIMISSDPKTSNQEKQEILSEIDEALQGLLEAVGKVETVDETRLDASLDSEVGNP